MQNTYTDGQDSEPTTPGRRVDAWLEHEIFLNRGNCLPNNYHKNFFDKTGMSYQSMNETLKRIKKRSKFSKQV